MAEPVTDKSTARARLYHQIRNLFSAKMAEYYRKHPDHMGDERSQKGQAALIDIVVELIKLLDEFEIRDKQEKEIDCG